jgi:heme iron utilization protein
MVRWPAGSVMMLVWGVSIRMFPLLDFHMRDADCAGGAPAAGCVLVAQSEHEGGVGGGTGGSTVPQFITPVAQTMRVWKPRASSKTESEDGVLRSLLDCLKRTRVSSSPSSPPSRISSRKHGGTHAASDQPEVPEPSFSERARTLVYLGRIGSLSTLSRKQPGFPFGSVMPYGLDARGRPIFLISTMAMHTQNLQADSRASLLVTQPDASGDPLGASRVTVMGNVATIPDAEVAEARKLYLDRHANSKYWVDFEDFSFYHMDVLDVYYVGGFGVMGWVQASDYDQAQPDPLADTAAGIIEHMNADHKDALILLARAFSGIESQEAAMTAVDRLGFHARLKTQDGMRGARIAFSREVSNPLEARKVLVEMVQQARQQL